MSKPFQYNGLFCLPTELLEILLSYLDVNSIKALRLTCNKLAKRCIGPRFLASIQHPLLDVSLENLRSLLALARNPDIRKKVNSITLLATILDIPELEQNVKDGYYIVIKVDGPRRKRVEVDYSPEELSTAKDDLIWLVEQKEARKNESPSELVKLLEHVLKTFGELDAIHLDGAVVRGRKERRCMRSGEWVPLWTRAAQVFSWVTRALAQSQASVKRFDIYQSNRKYGIEAANIGNHNVTHDLAGLEVPIKGLQSLEMSLSGDVQDALDNGERQEDMQEAEERMARKTKEQDSYGTPRLPSFFLKSTPSLRKLELSFRRTATLVSKSFRQKYEWIIHSIAHEAQFPMLEECTLAGFSARSDSVLLLFQKSPSIRSLTIHECHLSSGSWTPIFAHLEASMPELQTLDLSNLWGKHMQTVMHTQAHVGDGNDNSRQGEADHWQEGDGLVIWHTHSRPQWTRYTSTTGSGVHTICFNHEEIKRGLVSRPLNPGPGRVKSSAELWRWRNKRLRLYGPPS
ncbi:hypothetical protein ASPFODRAFT_52074 [Aspergillus luchuensis CBS 106.47]|uniref:F-box domain-containing protein n=1 Tax=Aspergillus luchuensis (strain CBS 106.47) TaxID=1137211 RepID=A0A1M3T4J4_ASPLC|nr:hypothetical protein ASPFODRAFT_52074 [Aspergillus luchuensis CBS 106.47]